MKQLKLILFYIISFTGGIITSLIGFITIMSLLPFNKVHTYHNRLYATIGRGGGGLELGCFFVCGEDCQTEHIKAHECGHGLQNCLGGPLFVFVIWIPSAIRYWYRELKYYRKGKFPPTQYDDIWFEGQATRGGEKYVATDKI